MPEILLQIFLVAFFLNLLWELIHSQLYTTCLNAPVKKYIPIILIAALKDGALIALFYLASVIIFGHELITSDIRELALFVILTFIFAVIDEKYSIRKKRWEYSKQMPTIFGVGLTPLLELAITGILTFSYVFMR